MTTSDHKLVITRMKTQWFEVFKHARKAKENTYQKKINTELLDTNKEKQEKYEQVIQERLIDESFEDSISLKKRHGKHSPRKDSTKKRKKSNDCNPTIENLSIKQKNTECRLSRTFFKKF